MCPILTSAAISAGKHLEYLEQGLNLCDCSCAWYDETDNECSVKLLPDTLHLITRVAITPPYKEEETEGM